MTIVAFVPLNARTILNDGKATASADIHTLLMTNLQLLVVHAQGKKAG